MAFRHPPLPPLHLPEDIHQMVRSHLANERTFLAWCRTSLSLTAFGFVLHKFHIFEQLAGLSPELRQGQALRILGSLAMGLGVLMLAVAGWRFLSLRRSIGGERRLFPILPDVALMVILGLMLLASLAFALHYLF